MGTSLAFMRVYDENTPTSIACMCMCRMWDIVTVIPLCAVPAMRVYMCVDDDGTTSCMCIYHT